MGPCKLGGGCGRPAARGWASEWSLCPQAVGNLLYYRFLNPAVVAPDAFDVVAMAAGSVLAAPQRHTLGAVAQVLQRAAAGDAFSGDSRHLRVLSDYLEQTHLKFRSGVLAPRASRSLLPGFVCASPARARGRGRGGDTGSQAGWEPRWPEQSPERPEGRRLGIDRQGAVPTLTLALGRQEVRLPSVPGAGARRALCDGRVLGHGGGGQARGVRHRGGAGQHAQGKGHSSGRWVSGQAFGVPRGRPAQTRTSVPLHPAALAGAPGLGRP